MVEILCDTSFLIHFATTRIKNISNIEAEIGKLKFLVPKSVIQELKGLEQDKIKETKIKATLDFIQNKKEISLPGKIVDESLLDYVKKNGGIVATLDKELKYKIKKFGGSIISFSNDKLVLES